MMENKAAKGVCGPTVSLPLLVQPCLHCHLLQPGRDALHPFLWCIAMFKGESGHFLDAAYNTQGACDMYAFNIQSYTTKDYWGKYMLHTRGRYCTISNTSDIWPSTSSCTAACPFLAIYLTTGFWGSIALGCIRFHYAHHTNQTQCITMFFDISESHYSSAVWWLYCISLSSLDYEIYIDI